MQLRYFSIFSTFHHGDGRKERCDSVVVVVVLRNGSASPGQKHPETVRPSVSAAVRSDRSFVKLAQEVDPVVVCSTRGACDAALQKERLKGMHFSRPLFVVFEAVQHEHVAIIMFCSSRSIPDRSPASAGFPMPEHRCSSSSSTGCRPPSSSFINN
jgi:hypothetical protein